MDSDNEKPESPTLAEQPPDRVAKGGDADATKCGEASVTGFGEGWDVVKDAAGNVTVSPKPAADGCNGQDVAIGPGSSVGPGGIAEASSTRPIPAFGHVLCQVCKRPTNSEVQNGMVDTPFVFTFNGQPRAIICYECYMRGTLEGARLAYQRIYVENEQL